MKRENKALTMFRLRRRRNKAKAWGLTLLIMVVNIALLLWLSPYILPLGYDLHTLQLDEILMVAGVIITLIQLIGQKKVWGMMPFPGRRIPALRRGFLHHHPKPISPLLPPLLLAHGTILIAISPGATIWSYLLPGETRRWASRLRQTLGPTILIGGVLHWLIINLLIRINPPLLYAHIIASVMGAISIPGIAAIMYALWGKSQLLPYQRVVAGLFITIIFTATLTLLRLPWLPLYLILTMRRCAEALILISIGMDILESFR